MQSDTHTQSIQAFHTTCFLSLHMLSTGMLVLILLSLPSHSNAHEFSIAECQEASDFIKNAALSRDKGITEAVFIDRIRDDIEIIRAFPPQLRWFVQDDDDAKFLLSAVVNVFQHPKTARAHQLDFFNACIANAKATSSTSRISM
jgi:hypothetical protein